MNEPSPEALVKVAGHIMAIRALSFVQIASAVCCIIVGIVQVAYMHAKDAAEWPLNSGVAIWGGFVFMGSGILGLATSFMDRSISNTKIKPVTYAHSWVISISYSCAAMMVAWNAWVGAACMADSSEKMWCHQGMETYVHIALAWMVFIFGIVHVMLALPVSITYCMMARALKGCGNNVGCGGPSTAAAPPPAQNGGYENMGYDKPPAHNGTYGMGGNEDLPPKQY